MKLSRLSLCTAFILVAGGCGKAPPAGSSKTGEAGATPPAHAAQLVDPLDKRTPLPLLPHMAAHQRENMRDHLAAIQWIVAAVAAGDFAGVERSAARIGYSEQMGQMCEHMGAGAPGFNNLALNFHHTADTIVTAAKTRDSASTLKAISATLQTCVACHAVYRQHVVDEATWKTLTQPAGSGASAAVVGTGVVERVEFDGGAGRKGRRKAGFHKAPAMKPGATPNGGLAHANGTEAVLFGLPVDGSRLLSLPGLPGRMAGLAYRTRGDWNRLGLAESGGAAAPRAPLRLVRHSPKPLAETTMKLNIPVAVLKSLPLAAVAALVAAAC
jgi:hypothetical protein